MEILNRRLVRHIFELTDSLVGYLTALSDAVETMKSTSGMDSTEAKMGYINNRMAVKYPDAEVSVEYISARCEELDYNVAMCIGRGYSLSRFLAKGIEKGFALLKYADSGIMSFAEMKRYKFGILVSEICYGSTLLMDLIVRVRKLKAYICLALIKVVGTDGSDKGEIGSGNFFRSFISPLERGIKSWGSDVKTVAEDGMEVNGGTVEKYKDVEDTIPEVQSAMGVLMGFDGKSIKEIRNSIVDGRVDELWERRNGVSINETAEVCGWDYVYEVLDETYDVECSEGDVGVSDEAIIKLVVNEILQDMVVRAYLSRLSDDTYCEYDIDVPIDMERFIADVSYIAMSKIQDYYGTPGFVDADLFRDGVYDFLGDIIEMDGVLSLNSAEW